MRTASKSLILTCTHSGLEKASELRQNDTVEGNADQRVHQHQYASGTRRRVKISVTCNDIMIIAETSIQ